MIITINGKQYEVKTEKELRALMERFNFQSDFQSIPPSQFQSIKEFVARWLGN